MRPLFTRFVERGRVAVINYGEQAGKLCVIVDVVDQNRVLIDGPKTITGIPRQQYNLKRLALTKFKINIPKGARLKTLVREFRSSNIMQRFQNSSWGRKLTARETKQNLSDFGRFKVMIAQKKLKSKLARTLKEMSAERRARVQKNKESFQKRTEGKPKPTRTKEQKVKEQLERKKKKKTALQALVKKRKAETPPKPEQKAKIEKKGKKN